MKSPKEHAMDRKILDMSEGKLHSVASKLLIDPEIQSFQEYANIVAIKRLGYNDHGPVHMRKVALNALAILSLLRDAGIRTTIEEFESGTYEDASVAVFCAAFLHDLGMSIGRQDHEVNGVHLAYPIIQRVLAEEYPDDMDRRIAVTSVALEGIEGHMGTFKVNSIEAGIILVADGCDMEKGRARIPKLLSTSAKAGDIHRFSASSIDRVTISKGQELPVRIDIVMSESVGLFQVEEVLIEKISASTIKGYIELYASTPGEEPRKYMGQIS